MGRGQKQDAPVLVSLAHVTPMSSTGHPHVIAYGYRPVSTMILRRTVDFPSNRGQFDTTIQSTVITDSFSKEAPHKETYP